MERTGWYYTRLRVTIRGEYMAMPVEEHRDRVSQPGWQQRLGVLFPMALTVMALPILGTPRGRAILAGALRQSLTMATRRHALPAGGATRPALPPAD